MNSSLPSNGNDSPKTQSKYKDFISTLPRGHGWNVFDHFYQYEGFWYVEPFLEGAISVQEHFQAQPTDIIVSSAPKSGTTWLKALTFAILTRTQYNDFTSPLLTTVPHECVPFLEFDLAPNSSTRNLELPLVATHIPYTSLPKSIKAAGCKIVYICRDPKDAFVSMRHFIRNISSKTDVEPIPLDEAFELFCNGVSYYGPHWDHVLGYWEASLECPERVLFIKYEDMMRDTVFYVKRLAEFMEYPLSFEEERDGMVQKIVQLCSFENLSNLEVNKTGKHRQDTPLAIENSVYFNKGKVGNWENHLTPEMAMRLDEITKRRLGDSGLTLHAPAA